MGVEIEQNGSDVTVRGKGLDQLAEPAELLDVGNSGTTIRLMLGIWRGVRFTVRLPAMRASPKADEACYRTASKMGRNRRPRRRGIHTAFCPRRTSEGDRFQSPVASAQIKSAVLLAGLQAEGTTTVTEPHKSRDHTERMLSMFGVSLREDETSVSIEGGQQLKAAEVFVPGDISSAAFSWQQHRLFLAVKSCFAMSDSIRPGRESSMS
ncbi:hypothetical protein PO124_15995 [Bacillus licheniformis]|nr:hypothetical protein [Bacillus licheniformis]